ncbi:MAG: DUF86 domain-containing protein [Nitrospinae bacterium]|nr:DUF86 domain-containing protein [Nitrospinota bacterium]
MLDASREALAFARNKSRNDLDTDRMLLLALVKSIEIIGEAASRLSESRRDEYPHVPWKNIVNMRNRLIHAYFDIDLDTVWNTVTGDLPPLAAEIEKILQDI